LLLALVITYLLIAALYESFLYPVVIMISVPLASVGGFVGLRMLNFFTPQRLDILTMLGFVILIGTVVNNAILIVDHALQLIRNRGGNHYDAVAESVRGRVRPIFMTTLTTVLGMSPLVLLPGAGSELYRGLGVVVLSGLLVSTVFTLFLVPMLFGLVYEARELALVRMSAGLFRRRRQDDAEPDDRRRGEGDVASELASATTNGSSSPSGTAQDLTHFSAGPDAG
jgi:HAE1 family hydrophobic/amphiphilic exporter-1